MVNTWIMKQTWSDLLFVHYQVPYSLLRETIPECFEIDTFENSAWISIVPFKVSGIRARYLPILPLSPEFLELNVRTYISYKDNQGVYFYSLDANNPITVIMARSFFSLNYLHANMSVEKQGNKVVYKSERVHKGVEKAYYDVCYMPTGTKYRSMPGSLEEWLTERYTLFSTNKRGKVFKGKIEHDPWLLQNADYEVVSDTIARTHNIIVPTQTPIVQYSRKVVGVKIFPVVKI